MKPLKSLLLTGLLMLVLILSAAAQVQEKYSAVKIYPPENPKERAKLLALLRVDHFADVDDYIQVEISASDIEKLKTTGYRYEILVPDVVANLEEVNRKYVADRAAGRINMDGTPVADATSRIAMEQPGGVVNNIIVTPSAFQVWTTAPTLGGYYTFAQMNTAMNNLVTAYPGLVTKQSLGTTAGGNNIWCIKISDNAATDEPNEPEVLFIGLQHAREAIGGSSMIFLMQYLCERYALDSRIKNLVDNREIYIIPCMNPDGWEYNRSTNSGGGGLWRKNRKVIATSPSTQYGVDLNRNWLVDWADCPPADASCGDGSPTSSNETYWGSAAFSELETQAVRNFVKTRNFVAMIDQHAYGPYYSLPFGRPSLHTGADTLTLMDQRFYTHIPALMGKYNGMRAGNSPQSVGYEVAGGVKDWMLKGEIGIGTKGKIYGMTGEGGYGAAATTFWPPSGQIVNLCKGMTFQNLQLIYAAGSYVDLQDMSDIALTAKSGSMNFRIKRIGLGNDPVTVTLMPLTNINSSSPSVTVASLPNYYDTYDGSISYTLPGAITSGQRVRFAWRVETGGYTYYDTITKFYNPATLFSDDMNTGGVATKWTVSAGWNYVTDSGYLNTRALTESPGTSYPAGVTTARTAQSVTNLNLSDATAAFITFQTRHRAENFRDKLQLQVSPNGTTWTAIAGKTTIQEPGTLEGSTINGQPALTGIKDDWVNEVYDLNAYLGQAALRFRFAFTSNASGSFYASQDEGFYIDNLKVIKSTSAFVVLAVNFTSFTGKLLPNATVQLDWEAVTDNQHSHFEVERSDNGIDFYYIGRVENNQQMRFIDANPLSGYGYYRIKGVSYAGDSKFTKVVTIQNNSAKIYTLYPNPVSDQLNLQILVSNSQPVSYEVVDLSGKIVLKNKVAVVNGLNTIRIDTKALSAQTYVINLKSSDNLIIATQKFVKQH